MKKVVVKEQFTDLMVDGKLPVPTEVLATSIKAIADGMKVLRSGHLNERCVVLLIQNAAPTVGGKPIPAREVKAVLEGIASLEKEYLK